MNVICAILKYYVFDSILWLYNVIALIGYSIVMSNLKIPTSPQCYTCSCTSALSCLRGEIICTYADCSPIRPLRLFADTTNTSSTLFVNVKLQIVRMRIMHLLSPRRSIYQVDTYTVKSTRI